MASAAVQLKVAGQTYRVVTSADPAELERLAKIVEAALIEVTPDGRQPSPQALVLAAITLAHDLEVERSQRERLERRHRRVLRSLLERIDRAFGHEPSAHVPESNEARTAFARARGSETGRGRYLGE